MSVVASRFGFGYVRYYRVVSSPLIYHALFAQPPSRAPPLSLSLCLSLLSLSLSCSLSVSRPPSLSLFLAFCSCIDDVLARTVSIRQTSNRGPLLVVAAKVKQLGYLDELNYMLANDDHDLHCRA